MFVMGIGSTIAVGVAIVAGVIIGNTLGAIAGLIWAGILTVIGIGVSAIISVLPLEGYAEPEERTTYIIKLERKNLQEKEYYLEKKDNTVIFAMNMCDIYSFKGVAYEEVELKGNIKICETIGCTKPCLKEIVAKPCRVVTFSNLFTKREYVFCVPKGTVLYASEEAESREDTKDEPNEEHISAIIHLD